MKRSIIDTPAAPRLDINRFIETLAEERGLDVDVIITTLEAALSSAYKKYQAGNQNIEIKIDDIISKYRTQLEQLKTNSTKINQGPKRENLIILTNIPNRPSEENIITKSPKITKENILDSQSQKHKFSSEFIFYN